MGISSRRILDAVKAKCISVVTETIDVSPRDAKVVEGMRKLASEILHVISGSEKLK